MRRKVFIVAILIVAMLLQCIMPIMKANAETSVVITLNSNLYKAVKSQLKAQGIVADYRDANGIIIISEEEIEKVKSLDLSNSEIDDLDNGSERFAGLEAFSNLEVINLHANYLTEKSNLNILDNFEKLTEVDLSSNQISSVKSIKNFHNDGISYDITNQRITGRTIITVDDSEEAEERITEAVVNLPDILLENENGFDPYWVWNERVRLTRKIVSYTDPNTGYTTSPDIDYERSFQPVIENSDIEEYYDFTDESAVAPYPYMVVKVAEGSGSNYRALKGLIEFKIEVVDSTSILANSQMTFYYAIVDEEDTGITFDDGNFYRATKDQLTEGQTINNDEIIRENTDVRNLYSRAYDEALIMVINTDDIVNNIPSLILNDKRIKDLKGLEEFVGLESDLDISYNYITTIKRLIELEENKENKEQEIREKYRKFLAELKTNVTGYDTAIANIKTAEENYAKAIEEYNKINPTKTAERTAKYNEAQGYLDAKADAEVAAQRYLTLIKKYVAKLYKIYEKEYKMVSLLPSEVNYLSYKDLLSANLDTIKNYATSIMDRVASLEQKQALTNYEEDAIIEVMTNWATTNGSEFKTTKTKYTPNPEGGEPIPEEVAIEYPISEFFEDVKKDQTLDITDFEEFVYAFKCIDVLSQLEQYSLIKRQFEGTADNYVVEALKDIKKVYEEKEYDLYFYDLINDHYNIIDGDEIDYIYIPIDFGGLSQVIGMNIEDYFEGFINDDYSILQLAHRQSLITDADINTYITLPRIKNLDMEDNKVRSLEGIETLVHLKNLNAWKNMVNDISNVDWSQFNSLKYLNLGYNQISDISPLQVLNDLIELNVSYNLLEGRFTFRLINMKDLKVADFSHNQYNDIQYANDQFILRAMGYDENGDGIADGLTVPEWLEATGTTISFQYQTTEMATTIVKTDDEFVEFELPLIFRQLEKMDNARTSFGVDSLGGLVEPEGTSVKLRVPDLGNYKAVVSVDGRNGNEYSIDGIGYGTICTIKYAVIESDIPDPVDPTTPTDPTDPTDPTTPIDPTNPTDPTVIEYGYPVADGFVYVLIPETTVADFTARLVNSEEYNVVVTENKTDKIGTGAIATITSKDGETVYSIIEVVVKGDVNGDGEVDALDSGIVRTVINDTYELPQGTTYVSAADVNSDGEIDSQDSMLILMYRADRITSFED